MEDRLKELKEAFVNWGEAKKNNAKLLCLTEGFARVSKEITEADLTPHTPRTKVVFGGEHFNLANMAGAMGVYSCLDTGEEPLLVKGSAEFVEPAVIEERFLLAAARVVIHERADKTKRPKKTFIAFVEVTNSQGALKAQFELHYAAKQIIARIESLEKIRKNAMA